MPGTTAITYENELLTSTAHKAGTKVIDQQDYDLPFLRVQDEVHGKNKPADEGGLFFIEPLQFDEHSQTTQLSTGYELINMAVQSVGTPAKDDWLFAVRPVVISEKEKMQNRGSSRIYDIAKERTRTSIAGARRQLHKRIWGLASILTDLNTLNGIDFADGFLEEQAVGAQTNIVHAVSKATHATSLGWQNQSYDAAGSASANVLIAMASVAIQARSLMGAAERESTQDSQHWYAHPTAFGHLRRALGPREMYTGKDALDGSRLDLMSDGRPVHLNRDMPIAGTVTTGDPMSMAFIDHHWVYLRWQAGYVFDMGEFQSPVNQLVSAMPIKWACQLATLFLGTSGVVFDAQVW